MNYCVSLNPYAKLISDINNVLTLTRGVSKTNY